MATMFVRHQVTDYATWRKIYDDFEPTRKKMGVTSHAVYRSSDDPSDITAYHEFATVESAKAFASSDELKNAMQNAGVAGPPTIWFTERT
jgi:hypothetical protein